MVWELKCGWGGEAQKDAKFTLSCDSWGVSAASTGGGSGVGGPEGQRSRRDLLRSGWDLSGHGLGIPRRPIPAGRGRAGLWFARGAGLWEHALSPSAWR